MKKLLLLTLIFICYQNYSFTQCEPGDVEIKVTFVSDLTGNQNDWTLTQGDEIILSGGPYSAGTIHTDIQTACVKEGSDLTFKFHDLDHYGIYGYFLIESCGNILAYHTGYMASYKYALIHAQAPILASEGEVEIYTFLNDVYSGDDLRWSITGVGGSPVYGSGNMSGNYNYEFKRTVVPEGIPLEYRLLNLNGGGLSSNGTYEVGYNCVKVKSGHDDFDILKIVEFDAPFTNQENVVFEKKIGNVDNENGEMISELCEGGFIIAGNNGPENIDPLHQIYLIKTNSAGEIIWKKQYGGNGKDEAKSVCQLENGNYLISGITTTPTNYKTNAFTMIVNHNGDSLLFKEIGGDENEKFFNAIETSKNDILAAGETNSFGNGLLDIYLVKTDALGELIFEKTYGNEFNNKANSVAELSDGSYLVVGGSNNSNNTPWNGDEKDALILKTNNNGIQQYYKTFGNPDLYDVLNDVKIIDKNTAIAGGTTGTSNKAQQAYLIKFNPLHGDTLWTLSFGSEEDDVINSLDIDSEGNYIVFGNQGNWYGNNQKAFIAAISPDGKLLWTKSYYHEGVNSSANSGIASSKGGYAVVGQTYYKTFPDNRSDIYFFKTDDSGTLVSKPKISGDTVFCEGDIVTLTASEIKVESGINYEWSNGMEGQTIEVSEPGDYYLTVTDNNNNQKTSDIFSLEQVDLPLVNIVSENDSFLCFGSSTNLNVDIKNKINEVEYSYLWSTGETSDQIAVEEEGIYNLEVKENTLGCTGHSSPFNLKVQKPWNKDKICMVTVDEESGKNMIIYTKTPDVGTKAFIVWKETEVSYLYEPIGAIDYNNLNYFIDEKSNPKTQANRYKLSVLDVCDNQSSKSLPHKTMHLTVNAAGGGADDINLIWDHYEGFYFGTYVIYRGSNESKMDSIHSIQSTLTSWTDDNPPTGDIYYQIGVRKAYPCVLIQDKKAGSGPFVHSLSNLEDNRLQSGMEENPLGQNSVVVYPNPFSEQTSIVYNLSKESMVKISLYNSQGEKLSDILNQNQDPGDYHIKLNQNITNMPEGLYFIKIQLGNTFINKALIKVKH